MLTIVNNIKLKLNDLKICKMLFLLFFHFSNHGKIAIFVATFLSWDLANFLLWKNCCRKYLQMWMFAVTKQQFHPKLMDLLTKDSSYFCIKYNMGSFRTINCQMVSHFTCICDFDMFMIQFSVQL